MSTHSSRTSAKDAVKSVTKAAKASAERQAMETKARVSEKVAQEADGWRAAAAQFKGDTFSKEAASHLADRLNDVAAAVRNADLSSIRSETEAFARRNPLLFFGGAALAGFVVARAVKASERAEEAGADAVDPVTAPLPARQRPDPGAAHSVPGAS